MLLKNKNKHLPVKPEVKRIAIEGPLADAPYEQLGTWVFEGDESKTVTPLEAIRKAYGDKYQIVYEPALAYSRDKNPEGIKKAVETARNSDMVIAFVGEESILSGEAHSLADINLQGKQQELIETLSKAGKPVVTIVMAGRPLTIGKQVDESDAFMYAWHPGTMGGEAIADLIFGKAVPSGKLPVTFPRMVGQIPLYYNRNSTGRPARGSETMLDQIPVKAGQTSLGCNSYWLDAGYDELFPFGYGLSYTEFVYDSLKLSKDLYGLNDTINVSLRLSNNGDYEAAEVVQLYVQDKVGSVTRPIKELKRFEKVMLKPGETKEITFSLPVEELAFWNIDMKKVVEPGAFVMMVGGDSRNVLKKGFEVK